MSRSNVIAPKPPATLAEVARVTAKAVQLSNAQVNKATAKVVDGALGKLDSFLDKNLAPIPSIMPADLAKLNPADRVKAGIGFEVQTAAHLAAGFVQGLAEAVGGLAKLAVKQSLAVSNQMAQGLTLASDPAARAAVGPNAVKAVKGLPQVATGLVAAGRAAIADASKDPARAAGAIASAFVGGGVVKAGVGLEARLAAGGERAVASAAAKTVAVTAKAAPLTEEMRALAKFIQSGTSRDTAPLKILAARMYPGNPAQAQKAFDAMLKSFQKRTVNAQATPAPVTAAIKAEVIPGNLSPAGHLRLQHFNETTSRAAAKEDARQVALERFPGDAQAQAQHLHELMELFDARPHVELRPLGVGLGVEPNPLGEVGDLLRRQLRGANTKEKAEKLAAQITGLEYRSPADANFAYKRYQALMTDWATHGKGRTP